MTTALLITLWLLALASRAWLLQRLAGRHALLRRSGNRWWTEELRRRACVCSVPNDLQAYPQPREFRIRVWRLAGVPVWWHGCFVSLPVHCDATVAQLDAQQFDHLFSGPFRLQAPGAAAARPALAG
ncbi:MAG: hypothetical protein KA774_15190 [Burkholderiaceae bacterium]|jgi:hypothetical protein|nr:hypothetical protein [Burkholderiaceae bacterium]